MCVYVNVNEQYEYFTNSRVHLISINVHMILLCLTFWYKFCPSKYFIDTQKVEWTKVEREGEGVSEKWSHKRFYIKNTLLECEQPHRLNVQKARRRGKGFW